MKMKRKSKQRGRGPRKHPVLIEVGSVIVQKDGSYRLLLSERVTSLNIAGPYPKSASLAEDEVPF